MKIVILGSSDILYNLIEGALKANAEIVGVVNWKDVRKKSFKDFFETDYTKEHIKKLKLPIIKTKSANSKDFKSTLLKLEPDVLLVGTWGEKIKKEIFDIPKIAAINVHPSLLPKYRGANPYSRAIMFGEQKTGVTFHLMNEKFDAGAVLLQKESPIYSTDNGLTLKKRLAKLAAPMCTELLQKLDSEILTPTEQDESQATYFPHVKEEEIVIEPEKTTYHEADCKIRGLTPWQSTYLLYKGEFFRIKDHTISKTMREPDFNDCAMCFETKDGKFIYFENLEALGWKKHFTKLILKFLHKSCP